MNLEQHTFVTEYLRHGDAMTAYSLACKFYTSDYEALFRAADNMLSHPEVAEAIRQVQDAIRAEARREIQKELHTEVLTLQEKRGLLAKIARGQTYAVHNYKGKDCSQCTQHVWPTINQMLRAIDLDNKMAGLYAVDKRQFTVNKSEKLPEPQHFTTNHLSPAACSQQSWRGGGVRRTGVAQPEQIATNTISSPYEAGDIGDALPVQEPIAHVANEVDELVDSHQLQNTVEPQQNTTSTVSYSRAQDQKPKQILPSPQVERGRGEHFMTIP